MLPFAYEWHWDAGHIIFMGLLYLVLTVIGTTLCIALYRAHKNKHHVAHILLHGTMHDAPASRIKCRYELTGRVDKKTCDQEFDCGGCDFHILRKTTADPVDERDQTAKQLYGFELSPEVKHYRGHTWVRQASDGTFEIGLGDMASRLVGPIGEVILPDVGTKLHAHGEAFHIRKNKTDIRVLSPLSGEITETGDGEQDWLLKLKTKDPEPNLDHLYDGLTAMRWSEEELKVVEGHLGIDQSPFHGKNNLPKEFPNADWPLIWHDLFLDV